MKKTLSYLFVSAIIIFTILAIIKSSKKSVLPVLDPIPDVISTTTKGSSTKPVIYLSENGLRPTFDKDYDPNLYRVSFHCDFIVQDSGGVDCYIKK